MAFQVSPSDAWGARSASEEQPSLALRAPNHSLYQEVAVRQTFLIPGLVLLGVVCICGVLSMPPAALGQKPAPQPPKNDYELRIIRVGKTFQGVRFKVSTGQSWTLAGDKFEKVAESGPVPPGDYDIQLITDDMNWMGFRIDRRTGATWALRDQRWVKFKEPEE